MNEFVSNNTLTYQILNINMSDDWNAFQLDLLEAKVYGKKVKGKVFTDFKPLPFLLTNQKNPPS